MVAVLTQAGGRASWGELRSVLPERAIKAAVASGQVSRPARGVYLLRSLTDSQRAALAAGGLLSHRSAALALGLPSGSELVEAAAQLSRQGGGRAKTALLQASGEAMNAFESALRALSIEAVGPAFVPQVPIQLAGGTVHPDLVCEELRIVAEADSARYHTTRGQIHHDCWRYDELTLDDWLVLRFAWEHVRGAEDWTRQTFRRAVARRRAVW